MRKMNKRMWLVLLVLLCAIHGAAQPLPQRIEALMESTGWLKTSEVGIAVYDLTDGQPLYRYQAEKLFRPASTEKIITSVTALAVLGTDYTFRTQLVRTGEIVGDTLKGDLYVVGHFDPEFSESDLQHLSAAVEAAGIRYISGRLRGDVSLMDSIPWGSGWAWDDAPGYYQPYLSRIFCRKSVINASSFSASKCCSSPVCLSYAKSPLPYVEIHRIPRTSTKA